MSTYATPRSTACPSILRATVADAAASCPLRASCIIPDRKNAPKRSDNDQAEVKPAIDTPIIRVYILQSQLAMNETRTKRNSTGVRALYWAVWMWNNETVSGGGVARRGLYIRGHRGRPAHLAVVGKLNGFTKETRTVARSRRWWPSGPAASLDSDFQKAREESKRVEYALSTHLTRTCKLANQPWNFLQPKPREVGLRLWEKRSRGRVVGNASSAIAE